MATEHLNRAPEDLCSFQVEKCLCVVCQLVKFESILVSLFGAVSLTCLFCPCHRQGRSAGHRSTRHQERRRL